MGQVRLSQIFSLQPINIYGGKKRRRRRADDDDDDDATFPPFFKNPSTKQTVKREDKTQEKYHIKEIGWKKEAIFIRRYLFLWPRFEYFVNIYFYLLWNKKVHKFSLPFQYGSLLYIVISSN